MVEYDNFLFELNICESNICESNICESNIFEYMRIGGYLIYSNRIYVDLFESNDCMQIYANISEFMQTFHIFA